MADGKTARDSFERLAYVIPRCSQPEGAEVAALARDLGTTESRILNDLQALTTRDEYRPGGWPGDICVLVESGRIQVEHTSFMERPFRLTGGEMFCLALALRGVMSDRREPDSTANEERASAPLDTPWDAFLRRAEGYLSQNPGSAAVPSLAVSNRTPDVRGIRSTLKTAVYERRPCVIRYLKPGAKEPSRRVIHPYLVLYSEETWYVVAMCTTSREERIFRLDRVLSAGHCDGAFDVPRDFHAQAYLKRSPEGVMIAPNSREALVRYSHKLARWIKERASYRSISMEEHDDGSVAVRHSVADPHWLAAHILRCGVHAEVLEPQDLRDMVGDLARKMAAF